MEQELESLENANPGPTPQQQQKEKELQEREAKVKQAEEGAKDATHKAQMAAKDTQAAADKLGYDEQVFELTQKVAEIERKMQAEVQQIREQFEQRALQAVDTAEGVMREAMNPPQGVTQ
jgi:transketolase